MEKYNVPPSERSDPGSKRAVDQEFEPQHMEAVGEVVAIFRKGAADKKQAEAEVAK